MNHLHFIYFSITKGNFCTSAAPTHTHFGMRYLLFFFEWGLAFNTHLLKEELSEKVKKEQEVLSFCLPALTSLQV